MRERIFSLILIFCLIFLTVGLFYTQIVSHEKYRIMSEENRLRVVPMMAPRGSILDRNGKPLVKDVLSFNAAVIYSQIKNKEALAKFLSSILGANEGKIWERMEKGRFRPHSLTVVAQDIGIEKATYLEELETNYPGLILDVSTRRRYINDRTASNVLGYLGLINRPEFERLKQYGYRINDVVGRDGIEKNYDQYLRGTHGGKQIEVDSVGREMTTMGYKEPLPGKNVYLTIDLELQKYCDSLLEGKRGVILAMNPSSGEVLAMSSAPGYDPEIFISRKESGSVKAVLEDKSYPLLNRAISGAYPPGSIFKVIVATGALETGKATPGTGFSCNGEFYLGRQKFRCWRKGGHGEQFLTEAIKNSCNVYFYRLGLVLGVDSMAKFAEKFGFGARTGIDLPGESEGVLPSRKWKRKHFNEQWFRGETVNYAIGQGYLLCTPLQIAQMMSAFANKGFLVRPYLVKRVGGVDTASSVKVELDISPESMETVRQGLWKVVNDPRGTGLKAKLEEVAVAGKTGTAQTARKKTHGWFAGFAPFDDPKLTVVVFDEYGGKGGYYAAGTASKVFHKAKELELL
ncbi:MAG: penicillin-binding protein 2 [Candidatus Omnitrophota bacterium]